ncbi:hypothetical protein [Nodosilinea sp. E11]|uniref:hypothetical protein n=1 Tax=Nodosilinea sp. E11 TaxID=3037479 RepID=UPI00293476F1|nr:hypothetical protein [Nodosilinea sp. E11]WOD38167.1 hypothetical protein RRF56_18310 [Nodosilinea sp. E11]
MVQNLRKFSLFWSIGGVGAIAIALLGLFSPGYDPTEPQITLNSLSPAPWQQGTALGWQAAVAAQTAQSPAEWQQVSDLWGEAIAALESVPSDDANFAQAQAKAEEYRGNQAIALARQAVARPAAALADLQQALAASDPAFTFTPDPAGRLVGQSADGLATVELAGDRATLVLPRSDQGALTMAQVVYANQFLALTAPEAANQPWLLTGLRDVQGDRPVTLPVSAPVTLRTQAQAIEIMVTQP